MDKKRKIIITLFVILWIFIPISIFMSQLTNFYSEDNIKNNVPLISTTPVLPDPVDILYQIIPSPSMDGNIELNWEDVEVLEPGTIVVNYKVYRRKDSGTWEIIFEAYRNDLQYYDRGLVHGDYEYKIYIRFKPNNYIYLAFYTNTVSITVVEPVSPLFGESISINDGATTTDSYDVELTLYCENAETMSFKFSSDSDWTTPEPYLTTKYKTLPEDSIDNPNYTVGVKYQKDTWETEPVYDSINVYIEGVPPPPPPPPLEEVDYTIIYILVGVLVGLVGIVVFMKYRKRGRKSKS